MRLDSHYISFIKGVTWRIIGTLDTVLISYFLTKSFEISIGIGGIEIATKTLLFYVHERIWIKVSNKFK